MATRSCIIIKVRKEDIGKSVHFDKNSLPVPLQEWIDKDKDGFIWRDEQGNERSEPVELKKVYLGIYCHWDGYTDGVGAALKELFNDYDKALNLIAGGFCSSVCSDGVKHYANRGTPGQMWAYNKWDEIKPIQGNTKFDVYKRVDCAHVYLFDEKRGGWLHKLPHNKKAGFKAY